MLQQMGTTNSNGILLGMSAIRSKLGGISRSTVYRWECSGILPAFVRIGGLCFMDAGEINKFVARARAESRLKKTKDSG